RSRRTKRLEPFGFVFVFAACSATGCDTHSAPGGREADRCEQPDPAFALRNRSGDRTLASVKERSRHSPFTTHGLVLSRLRGLDIDFVHTPPGTRRQLLSFDVLRRPTKDVDVFDRG